MPVAQKLRCRVERVVNHGDRVYTVALRPEHLAPRFRAGQFLHLALDPYDSTRFWPESRVFSIASAPSQRDLLRISYSVRGRFTARMEAEVVEGRDVWIKMPYGDFVVDPRSDAVLFAGGTGITAFTAFIEGLTPDAGQAVVLAYGARTQRLFIYRDVVERCARTVASMNAFYFVEQEDAAGSNAVAGSAGPYIGRVSVDAVWPQLRRAHEADYYISGPPAMLQTIGRDLRARGIAGDRVHIDAWE
jgi:ferredoxin-NADP reductase